MRHIFCFAVFAILMLDILSRRCRRWLHLRHACCRHFSIDFYYYYATLFAALLIDFLPSSLPRRLSPFSPRQRRYYLFAFISPAFFFFFFDFSPCAAYYALRFFAIIHISIRHIFFAVFHYDIFAIMMPRFATRQPSLFSSFSFAFAIVLPISRLLRHAIFAD